MSRLSKPAALLAALALLVASSAPLTAQAQNQSKAEAKCSSTLNKGGGKLISTYMGIQAKCLITNPTANCPDVKGQAKIDKAAVKLVDGAIKSCVSTCSLTEEQTCIDDSSCPAFGPNINDVESCSAGGKKIMRASRIGFPGSACGNAINTAADMAECTDNVATTINAAFLDQVFGTIDGDDISANKDAGKCLSQLAKTLGKSVGKITKSVGKCREGIETSVDATFSPEDCSTADAKVAAAIAKTAQKIRDTVSKSCPPSVLGSLDICGGLTDIPSIQDCLENLLLEASSTTAPIAEREYLVASLINAAYPVSLTPTCGDNAVNQTRNQFYPLGEECDGIDDSACPGQCAPPGDRFECTCPDTAFRVARIVNPGDFVDLDNGVSGNAFDSTLPTPFVQHAELSNCGCAAFSPTDPATCITPSGDDICDVLAITEPRCSFATGAADPSCDTFGLTDGINNDVDCQICDDWTATPGTHCAAQSECQSQCFAAADTDGTTPLGNCASIGDCGAGEFCRGLCSIENTCVKLSNGAPLPLAAASTRVCVVNFYDTDITGTANIVTGEHLQTLTLRSQVFQADTFITPCPVCGGFCDDNSAQWARESCQGSCTETKGCVGGDTPGATCTANADCPGGVDEFDVPDDDVAQCWGVPCRFDDDCPGSETCGTESPICAIADSNGRCNLNLLCSSGDQENQACRIEATHPVFGTTSGDCQPSGGTTITPGGFKIVFDEVTSEPTTWPVSEKLPCDGGFDQYDCQCNHPFLAAGGTPNRPNNCWSTCDAVGPNFGLACVPGAGSRGTRCVGGSKAEFLCDEVTDCPDLPGDPGTCSNNPLHCFGGTEPGNPCVVNADCDGGGTCGDACPTGRCVAQCLPNGGGTEQGICPDGPITAACSGTGFQWLGCGTENLGTTRGCDNIYPGAGTCNELARRCHLADAVLEGGDTINGEGDPTNFKSVAAFCVRATSGTGVNSATGLPGNSMVRQAGTTEVNFTSIP